MLLINFFMCRVREIYLKFQSGVLSKKPDPVKYDDNQADNVNKCRLLCDTNTILQSCLVNIEY